MVNSAEVKVKPADSISADSHSIRLSQDLFIGAWVDVGKCLGFSQTAVEVHGLLYICGRPLCTDEVMARLNISRGNVSMCLRTLKDWGMIRRVHMAGARKEHFESLTNIRDVFRAIVTNKIGRHLNPALKRIRQCNADTAETISKDSDCELSLTIMRSRLSHIDAFLTSLSAMSHRLTINESPAKKPQQAKPRAAAAAGNHRRPYRNLTLTHSK